jgi:hypothetical protein
MTSTQVRGFIALSSTVCAVASVWQPAIGIAWIIGFLVWRDMLRTGS